MVKSSKKYKAIQKALSVGKYEPTIRYRMLKWRGLTGQQIDEEYQRMLEHIRDRAILKEQKLFSKFVKSDKKNFRVQIEPNETVFNKKLKNYFLIISKTNDKFIAEMDIEDAETGQIKKRIKSINKSNAVELIESLTEEEDYDKIFSNVKVITRLNIKRLDKPKSNKNKREGAYFPYYNKNNNKINLERYQIFENSAKSEYKTNCFVNAMEKAGFPDDDLCDLILFIKTKFVPLTKIKEVAAKFKININIRIRKKDDTNWKIIKYNKNESNTYNICLYENHYFVDEITKYTAYSIKNFNTIKDKDRWYDYFKKSEFAKEGERRISSWKLIDLMFKNNLFEKIPIEDIAQSQFYETYKTPEPTAKAECVAMTYDYEKKYNTLTKKYYKNDYNNPDEDWKIKYYKTKAKDYKKNIKNIIQRDYIFADFETDVNGEQHMPFMISYLISKPVSQSESKITKTIQNLTGPNCAVDFLTQCPDHCVIYFHNLGYDLNFIYEHVETKTIIKNGSFVYLLVCKFQSKTLEFRDTYCMIPDRLANFPKMFGMADIKKEIMPYTLYTVDTYNEPCDINEVKSHLKSDDWKPFLELAQDYILEDGKFDKLEYAKFYCDRDVELLYEGYNIFRKNIIKEFDLDPLCYLTISSLSNDYLMKSGCFKDVYKIGDMAREFIQASVRGGRCMTRRNEKFEVKETLNDFDGVSLYPSAMYIFDGFLKGKPKKIINFEPEKYSHYFVKIKITKVNNILDFPLISVRDDDGILQYKNETTTMYVDKYALEDLIEFQGIEYEFIEGLYFDEGFNTQIKDTIKHMFDQRLKYKKEKNPIQVIYKLIMNSSYGKTIMKEHLTNDTILNEPEFNDYVFRNHNYIKNIEYNGKQYWITENKITNSHMSYPHVGSIILSYSKRIMNQVFGIAHDNNIPIYYQDTDSMHVRDEDVKELATHFRIKYNRELVGKGLGQFHCDFDLEGCDNPVSTRSIFLGKKTYIDKLEGKDKSEKKIEGLHFRFKGIPAECIEAKAIDMGTDVFKIYEHLLNSNEKIDFDLVKGIGRKRPVFKNYKGIVSSEQKFVRSVGF
jgi:hypothetical protein